MTAIAPQPIRAIRRRLVALAIAVVTLSILAGTVVALNTKELTQRLDHAGALGAVLFLCLATLLITFLFSGSLLATAGGLLYGLSLGSCIAIAAFTLAGTLSAVIARAVATSRGCEALGGRISRWSHWLEGRGFRSILISRLVPGMPFNTISYAAGITSIPIRKVFVATALGIAPRAFVLTSVGDSLQRLGSVEARASLAATAAMIAVAFVAPPVLRHAGFWPGRSTVLITAARHPDAT